MSTLDHIAVADSLRTTLFDAPLARCGARQGDVILQRVGDPAADARHEPTPQGGMLVAGGLHGEHRLIGADVAWLDDGTFSVRGDMAGVVHTDVPNSRHGPIRLCEGTWTFHRAREMQAGEIVQVQD